MSTVHATEASPTLHVEWWPTEKPVPFSGREAVLEGDGRTFRELAERLA